jgi:hypothetical protein
MPKTTKPKSTQRALGSMLLAFESFVVFFGLLATFNLPGMNGATVWAIGLALSVLMIATPGILGRRGSYLFGWMLQAAILVLSIVIATVVPFAGGVCILVSVIFIGLWSWAMIAGTGIDAARKVYLEGQALLNAEEK